ncbi:MAG: hypothetical protein UR39_C0004G0068 [Candidatus Woesebacteria bacterium GW2011_GWA1_33_30]|uniref:Uncharacterized protein n=1 Tax=Candidatus Woesebacteria bacterium GW2011_GWA2_33_28 TaxID=1618561 RepID=A0A0G0CVQ3_9BACT|nr:MAG: hypothetical protein UR38_C0004G0005 [Candidatus Woesebacteria bacterium GW2011_GWA2_33_28]KKP48447.1 MAG: hypothetical protein UR39_C0004G0068 [Candidatus Woesebacteria bacterium GW2011_GWA1_33_30]KKP49554.1 MAG: hypothetical protein UR40_C0005G0068 [Microgenomates group bacterium GW2011_GWC1_33_32]KKP52519.1 MAG: hypothetical protein UR44_C0002G0068 [Candidatus Woesebacteria bacterium GW2011_GWB1_33_38]KKP55925.1 MAG: hypothetical protein UR48_C0045G0004 [Microgenomates group bacteriu
MKGKIVLFIIIGIFLLGLVGWVSYSKFKGNKTVSTGSNSEKSGIFTSVKDALTQKLTLSCEFTDETGTVVKSYIKNGAVRVSSIGNGDNVQANEIIIKDKKMYMWEPKTKAGFIYIIPDQTENSQVGTTNQDVVSSESYLNMIDQYKDSCKVATVADSYFTAPTDVNFQDMSKLLEDLQKYGNPK